jgi:hypothetical protein
LAWFPFEATVSAAISAHIGYRNENIFCVGNKARFFWLNGKTPVGFAS